MGFPVCRPIRLVRDLNFAMVALARYALLRIFASGSRAVQGNSRLSFRRLLFWRSCVNGHREPWVASRISLANLDSSETRGGFPPEGNQMGHYVLG